jgi:hypothetical protein
VNMEAADGGRVKVLLPPVRLRFFVYSGYTLSSGSGFADASVSFSLHRRMTLQLLLLRLSGPW